MHSLTITNPLTGDKLKAKYMENKTRIELTNYVIDCLNDGIGIDMWACDLHNELFNTDYYIIGRYNAEQWLINNGGIFQNIDLIKEYEESNFGEVNTNLSEPENIVNMAVYIYGEEILANCKTFQDNWDGKLTERTIELIIEDLKESI